MTPLDRWRAVAAVRGVTGAEKAVLGCLAFHAGDREPVEAFPAVQTIADETGFGTTTVRKALRGLAAAGWIAPVCPSAGRHANRYRLHLPEPIASRGVEPIATRGVNPSLSEGQPFASRAPTLREALPNQERTRNEHSAVAPDGSIWNIWTAHGGGRSSLGRLIRDHGEEAVAQAIAVAATKGPADFDSYVRGVLRKQRTNGTDVMWMPPV